MSPVSYRAKLPLLLCVLAFSGCQHLCTYQALAPARVPLPGVHQVSVVDFGGEHGNAVAAALSARLWNADFHTVVDSSQFAPVRTASLSSPAGMDVHNADVVLAAAREAGVDGVLMGEVIDYRCEDERFTSTHFGFGQGVESGGGLTAHAMGVHFSADDTLVREGTVTIAYRLVDPATGEVVASDRVSRSFEGRIINNSGTLPSQGEVLDNLLNECASEIVSSLAPHEVDVQVQLMTSSWWQSGARDVRQGVAAAEKGDWEQARGEWEAALEKNPDNDAAMFNLAWLAARERDFPAAEDLAMQALCSRHREEYTTGLEEIRRQRDLFVEAQRQRDALTQNATAAAFQ
jgi:hypothetical protein